MPKFVCDAEAAMGSPCNILTNRNESTRPPTHETSGAAVEPTQLNQCAPVKGDGLQIDVCGRVDSALASECFSDSSGASNTHGIIRRASSQSRAAPREQGASHHP